MQIDFSKIEFLEKEAKWAEALVEYDKLYAKNPCTQVLSKIGWCNSRLGNYKHAIDNFTKLSEIEPSSAKWCYMVGFQYYSTGDWNNAIEWFRKAIKIYPDYFVVRYRLGYALTQICGPIMKLKSKDFLEAFKQFEECEKIWNNMSEKLKKSERSNYANVLFQKSKIYIERKDWENAHNHLLTAMQYKDDKNIKYELGKVLYFKGKYDEAMSILQNIKSDYHVEYYKGQIYIKTGNYSQALRTLEAIAKRVPKDFVLQDIAEIYLKLDEVEKAYQASKKSISLKPNNHKNYFIMGQVCYKAGLLIRAKESLIKANDIKKTQYGSPFTEALQLINLVTKKIDEEGILVDDEALAARFENNETKNSKSGIITKYKNDKGFGFIKSGTEDYFFHISQLSGSNQLLVKEGLWVKFIPGTRDNRPIATELSILKR